VGGGLSVEQTQVTGPRGVMAASTEDGKLQKELQLLIDIYNWLAQ
jgi:hypothetical protein